MPEDKAVQHLRANDSQVLRHMLYLAYHPEVRFLLPEGPVPTEFYKPSEFDEPLRLYQESRRFYIFVQGGGQEHLKPHKREQLFIDLVSSLEKEEGELVMSVKDKKLPYANITPELVKKAFPDLL